MVLIPVLLIISEFSIFSYAGDSFSSRHLHMPLAVPCITLFCKGFSPGLDRWFSTGECALREHFAMPGDIFDGHRWGVESYGHLGGRGQR